METRQVEVDLEETKKDNDVVARKKSCNEKMLSLVKKLPKLGEIFELHHKVGEGTFSNVYLATLREVPKAKYAVKHLVPTCHPSRVVRELKCMQEIGGVDNVSGIYMCLRQNDCITFVMPYQHHDKFSSYFCHMDVDEIRLYIRELCVALRRVHSFGVLHRDVKPGNFLYDKARRKFLLVDFGLSQMTGEWSTESSKKRKRSSEGVSENKEPDEVKSQLSKRICPNDRRYGEIKRAPLHTCNDNIAFVRSISQVSKDSRQNLMKKCECDYKAQICNNCLTRRGGSAPRAGTPGFRAPEVLMKSHDQTTAVDMWAVGVILLCILSRTYPFFRSPDDVTALAEMITLFGSEEVKQAAKKLGRNIVCSEVCKPLDLQEVCKFLRNRRRKPDDKSNDIDIPDEAFSLLYRLLDLDHTSRITAEETLSHPFIVNL